MNQRLVRRVEAGGVIYNFIETKKDHPGEKVTLQYTVYTDDKGDHTIGDETSQETRPANVTLH